MTGLLLGARWKLFVCLLLFIFTILLRKKDQSRKVISVKKLIASLSVILLLVLVLFAFMYLFSTRGVLPADEQYHFYLGDMSLKYGAQTIYNMTDGVIQPLYRAFDYIGQAPYVFSVLFADYMPDQAYFGSFVLRPIGEIASIIGLPFLTSSDIVADTFTGDVFRRLMGSLLISEFMVRRWLRLLVAVFLRLLKEEGATRGFRRSYFLY